MPAHIETGEKLVKMPVTFPEDLYEWLREQAFRRHVPMAEVVREALREYRERVDAHESGSAR